MCLKITCEWQHWLLIFYNVVSKNKRENDKNTFMKDLSFLWRQSFSADLSVEPTVAVDAQVLVLLDHINILSQDRHRPCSRPPPSQVDRQFPGLIRVQKQMTPPTTCGKVIPLTWSCYFSVCVWCLWDLISTLWSSQAHSCGCECRSPAHLIKFYLWVGKKQNQLILN